MTWNPALTIITVYGTIQLTNPASGPASGYIRFTSEFPLTDAVGNIVSGPIDLTARLDVTGSFGIELPATNDPDISPIDWVYRARVSTTAYNDDFEFQLDYQLPGGSIAWTAVTPILTPPAPAGVYAPYSEIAARMAADTVLQGEIDTETLARIAADTTLQTNITAEATTRATADTTLQTNISAEATTRGAADTTLQNEINAITGAGIVTSVNTQTGAVVLTATDVGAVPTGTAVLLTGNQTVAGIKTFSSNEVIAPAASGATPALNIAPVTPTDGTLLLRFNTEQPWSVKQSGTGASAALVFQPSAASIPFQIRGQDGTTLVFTLTPVNSVGGSTVAINGRVSAGRVNNVSSVVFAGRLTSTGAPSSGTWSQFDMVVDSAGVWWLCTIAGTPGTWVSASPVGYVTTKGDILAATGSGAISRLGAGTNNQYLVADSAQATGLKYVTGATKVTTFTASGNWTMDTRAISVRFRLISGGSGGGSGARMAAAAGGGGGGAPGGQMDMTYPASVLPTNQQTVTVGAGGAGATSIGADNTNGGNGTNGGPSSVGTIVNAFTNNSDNNSTLAGGRGGTVSAGGATGPPSTSIYGNSGGGGAGGFPAGVYAPKFAGCTGGGGGGGINVTSGIGGAAYKPWFSQAALSGGAGSVAGGGVGANGGTGSGPDYASTFGFGGGGSGGGSGTTGGSAGGTGGTGGSYGGGGGGGGGCLNGFASGAGGPGGPGIIEITEYL